MNSTSSGHRVTWQLVARIAGSLLSLALLVYLLAQQGWAEILDALQRIPLINLLGVAGLVTISRLAITARWYSLLRSVADEPDYLDCLRLTLAGLFSANFLPTTVGGDVVRVAGVLRLTRQRMAAATSVVADRLVGLFGMAMAVPFGIREILAWLATTPGNAGRLPMTAVAIPGLPEARLRKLKDWFRRMLQALTLWKGKPRALLLSLAFTWVHMLCLFSIIMLLLSGMGERIGFLTVAGLWSFTYFVTLMPFSINGLGLREVSIAFIFTRLGGISLEGALTLALILRTMDMVVSLPGALFVPAILSHKAAQTEQ
jgi:uncharacterized membrane protein YbhN (UPF0104 family)